jgi:CDP-glucose 4,6-dehydratase
LAPWPHVRTIFADLRELAAVSAAVERSDPEIVIHMASQAIVRRSFREPVSTFSTNVMGTAHLLQAVFDRPGVKAILVVTSDKVYHNRDLGRPFHEDAPLLGDDPYSASKVGAENVVRSWRESFLRETGAILATARAGNVIGGGDWAEDRLVPDVIRAAEARKPLTLRYPEATRPWQYVLDVAAGYLRYVELLACRSRGTVPFALNFGPAVESRLPTVEIVEALQSALGSEMGWQLEQSAPLPEKSRLALDATLAEQTIGWHPRLTAREAINWVARWHLAHRDGADMRQVSLEQIAAFEELPR